MAQPEFGSIVRAFADRAAEIGGTYFRVIEKGFQPVDLDATFRKPMVGIGDRFSPRATAAHLEASMPQRIASWKAKREQASASREKQVEAAVVRAALGANLRLEGLRPNLRFLASQWRVGLGCRGEPVDLLAMDVDSAGIVVIELKPESDEAAIGQASRYAENLRRQGQPTSEFFAALGLAMARLYDADRIPGTLVPGQVTALAAWPVAPGASGFTVTQCP
jgi:hypothetical protein